MKQYEYGISAVNLGDAVPSPLGLCEQGWEQALSISDFYYAGGKSVKTTPTKAYLAWDEENLYVRVVCDDPHYEDRADKNENTPLERKDVIKVAVQTAGRSVHDYEAAAVYRDGRTEALHISNASFAGGDRAFNWSIPVLNEAQKEDFSESEYEAKAEIKKDIWTAFIKLPWKSLGGKPESDFKIQIFRAKHQTNEILTPFPQDMNVFFRYSDMNAYDQFTMDPTTFMIATLGGEKKLIRYDKTLSVLASGVKRWQRPTVMLRLDEEEKEAIFALQNSKEPTTPKTLEKNIHLAQRWQDMLTLEGFDFFYDQQDAYPWPLHEPWVDRRLVNTALENGDEKAACKKLDDLLEFMRKGSSWWFADGSPMNMDASAWETLGTLKQAQTEEDEIELTFTGSKIEKLYLSVFKDGGVRLHAEKTGRFVPKKHNLQKACIEKNKCVVSSEKSRLEITFGENWSIDIFNAGNEKQISLTKACLRALANGRDGYDLMLPLAADEVVYGLGERFDAFNNRGRAFSLWQRDSWESTHASIQNQTYKNIPLLHSTKGYTLFWNSSYRMRADVGSERKDVMRLTIGGSVLDLFFWPVEPFEALNSYTDLTGKPLLPPKWAFETWPGGGGGRWKSGPLGNAEREINAALHKYRERDIPGSAVYAEGVNYDLKSRRRSTSDDFGSVYRLVTDAAKLDFRLLSWGFSVISKEDAKKLLPDVSEEDLPLVKVPNADEFAPNPPTMYIDFTHPRAGELLRAQWKTRLEAGIAGSMVDFGDRVADSAQFHDHRLGDEVHNAYSYEYSKAFNEMFSEKRGDDFVLYVRSATAGSQAFAGLFGGDHPTNYLGLTSSIYGGLAIGACAFPFWGMDMGGYIGKPDEETYLRWIEYGCFCPWMRFHGTATRCPWDYSEEAVEVYRFYAWLRENLLPYSFHTAVQAHHSGVPMMRAMPLAFPKEKELWDCQDEYMYGDDILVAPIHAEGNTREVLLPSGTWVDFWSGKTVPGSTRMQVYAPLNRIPLYIRSGAAIPMELNETLDFGRSMSKSRVPVLILTLPAEKRTVQYYSSGTRYAEIVLNPTEKGFDICVNGTSEIKYLIVSSVDTLPKKLILNGRELPASPAKQDFYEREGFIVDKNRLIVRLQPHDSLKIEVIK